MHLTPLLIVTLAILFASCDNQNSEDPLPEAESECIIPESQISFSVPRDAIPALQDPILVSAEEATYLKDDDLILGIEVENEAIAIPHNILWWHEIVNLNNTTPKLSVTFCPLTGSGLAFDRARIGDAEFGVSGLLWLNNNVLYDRRETNSLWSQMLRAPICGDEKGNPSRLTMYPILEMNWAGWKELHPNTQVVTDDTGFNRNYEVDPIGEYKEIDNTTIFWPMPFPFDPRRQPKERILGIPDAGLGGVAFPFEELSFGVSTAAKVVHETVNGQPAVVFYERDKNGAAVYWLSGEDSGRTFSVQAGRIIDDQTGSTWRIDGLAVKGSQTGRRLEPISEAYVSYWFAWVAFQPETEIWIDPDR